MVSVTVFKDGRSDAERALDNLRTRMPDIDRRLRNMFAHQIVGVTQQYFLAGQALKRRTGDLASSITSKDAGPNETMVGSYGVPYARIHELGGVIQHPGSRPRKKKALRWIGPDGKARFALRTRPHAINMPRRPYLISGIHYYFETRAEPEAETFLQRELDKAERA